MYSAGIIGCGFIGTRAPDNHAQAYEDNPNTNLIAKVDIGFTLEDIYDCNIISVCTPIETHWEVVKQIEPLAILLEKPIAPSLNEADSIINHCHKNNILLVVNHQRRFINPKFTFSRGILNTGTHAFDLIRKLFGEITDIQIDRVITESGVQVDIEYKDSMIGEFNLDCTRSTERMIPNVIEYIVDCLDTGNINQDLAIEARRDLQVCLKYQELYSRK